MQVSPPPYFAYQLEAIVHITNSLTNGVHTDGKTPITSFLLYDEMGCGKTLQTFGIMSKLGAFGGPTIVVAPSSCLHVWSGPDYQQYFSDKFNVHTIDTVCFPLTNKDILLVSYGCIRVAYGEFVIETEDELKRLCRIHKKHIPVNATKEILQSIVSKEEPKSPSKNHEKYTQLLKQRYGLVVMDEVHRMKNGSSKTTKSVSFINREYSLALSGTPIMNHGGEMLNLLWYALQLYHVDYSLIKNDPSGKYCTDLLSMVSLGRLKDNLHELEGRNKRIKRDEHVFFDWDNDDETKRYKDIKQDIVRMIDANGKKVHILAKLQELRQACLTEVKMEYFYGLYTEYSEHTKLICASTYKSFLTNVMSPWLSERNVNHVIFCGNGKKKQQQALHAFETDPAIKVMLIVKQAGALGLNLQCNASVMVLMDPHYNESLDEQVVQRIDRIGQTDDVVIRKLFMKGSIDEAILQMQQQKQLNVNAWLNRNDELSTMQIMSLFLKERDTV